MYKNSKKFSDSEKCYPLSKKNATVRQKTNICNKLNLISHIRNGGLWASNYEYNLCHYILRYAA